MISALLVAAVAGLGLALAASAHCLVMCGPLAAATRSRGGANAFAQYAGGRFATYTLLGLVAGSVGKVLVDSPWARWGEAGLSWLLAVSLLLTALTHLRKPGTQPLLKLGRAPRKSLFGALLARAADEPLLLGMATALLPCGALFSAVLAAAALGGALQGAVAMGTFALGSSVALLAAAQLSRLSMLGASGRRVLGTLLLAGAAVMILRPLPMLQGDGKPAACHQISARAPEGGLPRAGAR